MQKQLKIEGMACKTCVMHVEKALSNIDGVKKVKVSLKDKNATVKLNDNVSDGILISAVENAGYKVTSVDQNF